MRVTDVSPMGFESFSTTTLMEKNDFLTYVGLCDGTCLPPCRDDLEHNQLYHQFKEQYHISLNKQQERALQVVEGSNLLLAVPGSGKPLSSLRDWAIWFLIRISLRRASLQSPTIIRLQMR